MDWKVADCCCGTWHTVFRNAHGKAVCLGYNGDGQAPPDEEFENVRAIAAGSRHTVLVFNDGTTRAFGFRAPKCPDEKVISVEAFAWTTIFHVQKA